MLLRRPTNNSEAHQLKRPTLQHLLLTTVLVFSGLVFLPGLSGPFIFDDVTNLLGNSYIQIRSLDRDSLYHAAFSLESGPLQRPLAMLSFAVNYYFVGSFADSTAFKTTNLVIHLVNGLLVFWLTRLISVRMEQRYPLGNGSVEVPQTTWLAFGVALLWLVHPIQVSSVLYVVQRMTELSALFTLAAVIGYLKGRIYLSNGQVRKGALVIVTSVLGFGFLGIFSKENAVLLPVFLLVVEFILFPGEKPWNQWHRLTRSQQRMTIAGVTLLSIVVLTVVVRHALPAYEGRRFDLTQRLLTESRVLFFYLSLMLLPQIHRYGNQHDDIEISVSVLDPWTTLPALLGHAVLLLTAILMRKRLPLASLGILWFYAGHLLESTVIALEIAHEHRNYLPSFGVILAIAGLVQHASTALSIPRLVWIIPALAMVFGAVTMLRSSQWSNEEEFHYFEAVHHPRSARTQVGYARVLAQQGADTAAIAALRRAADIEPFEVSHLLQIALLQSRSGTTPSHDEQEKILSMLRTAQSVSVNTVLTIQQITGCLTTACRSLRVPMEQWLKTMLEHHRSGVNGDMSYYHYALGQTLASQGKLGDAVYHFDKSHELDPHYLHPLFAIVEIFVQTGNIYGAEMALSMLREANAVAAHPRTRDINAVAANIEELKKTRNR